MSRTYKDVPARLIWQDMPDDVGVRQWLKVADLSKAVRRKARKVVERRPKHPAMMRSFEGAYCRYKDCCRVTGFSVGRTRRIERRKWQKEVEND